jgi:UDP-GlcNAc3NAcA epimerase
MKVVTVVGARPQFVKAVPLTLAFRKAGIEERLVHTGQHYDTGMSDAFFRDLGLPKPAYNLGAGSGSHGVQTGRMLELLDPVLIREKPQWVVVFGDTNSSLAGALSGVKLHIPVAHVESGLRSFNRHMPEEINRILIDHISTLLYVPTKRAIENLAAEGITRGVIRTGDIMLDTIRLFHARFSESAGHVLKRFAVDSGDYCIATVHRPENTENPGRWEQIVHALCSLARDDLPVIWPVHPRIEKHAAGLSCPGLYLVHPLSYFDMQSLIMHAKAVLTDSGGLQKEAAFHRTPCITLRDETEWVELIDAGVNVLAGADSRRIIEAVRSAAWPAEGLPDHIFGDGHSAGAIVASLEEYDAKP